MAQALIRNIDEELLADYREAAEANGRSLEAELRNALRLARPLGRLRREELLAEIGKIRVATAAIPQTPSDLMLREARDHDD